VPAKPRWGLHQLDSRWAAKLVADANVHPGDLVIDVGAGYGAITASLVSCGARVIAVELHRSRAAWLREEFCTDPVVVVVADAADLRLPTRPFRVVANPPFASTVGLLRRLTAPGSRLVRADLLVPSHVARRWTSPTAPGAGRWAREFVTWSAGPIPRQAFSPPSPGAVELLVVERRTARPGGPRGRSWGRGP
jgi:23S rRNA (adenine-N6)-dimethyltransferase